MVTLKFTDDDDGFSTCTLSDGGNPARKPESIVMGGSTPPTPLRDFVEGEGKPVAGTGDQLPIPKKKRRKRKS